MTEESKRVFIINCIDRLGQLCQAGSIKISEPSVSKEYVDLISELQTKDEIVTLFTKLKTECEWFPSLAQVRKKMGYPTEEQQKKRVAYEIYKYIVDMMSSRTGDASTESLSEVAVHYYQKLGRSQGINLQLDDKNGLQKLEKLIDIHWEAIGPQYTRQKWNEHRIEGEKPVELSEKVADIEKKP